MIEKTAWGCIDWRQISKVNDKDSSMNVGITTINAGAAQSTHETPNDMGEVLEELAGPIGELAASKGIVLKTEVVSSCRRYVMIDRLSVQKVFLNLLSNAIKFTAPGGTVTFACA